MMAHWMKALTPEVYGRLVNCATRRADLPELVNVRWLDYQLRGKDKHGYTKEDALVEVLELLDENGREFDLTIDEYNELL